MSSPRWNQPSGTLYFEDFLRNGFAALPGHLQHDHSELVWWQGVDELVSTLRMHVRLLPGPTPLLASRSANLVRIASRSLVADRGPLLITDLTWPSYERLLCQEAVRAGAGVVKLRVRASIFEGGIGPEQVAHRIARSAARHKCRGLFVPAVSHDGIRFPLELLSSIRRQVNGLKFIVVDGAQALGHVPVDLNKVDCDFFVTGSHKWLGGHLPLGIGFLTDAGAESLNLPHRSNDPLMNFLHELRGDAESRFGETVNLMPLFSCRAALAEHRNVHDDFAARRLNADVLAGAVGDRWKAIRPHPELRSGILIVASEEPRVRRIPPALLRDYFLSHGISLTVYHGGRLRMAMPAAPFSPCDVDRLSRALHAVDCEHVNSITKAQAITRSCN